MCACVCACVRFGKLLQRAGCRFELPNLVSHSRQGQEAQFACKAQTLLLRVSCLTILFSRRSDLQCCGSLFMGEREWERGRDAPLSVFLLQLLHRVFTLHGVQSFDVFPEAPCAAEESHTRRSKMDITPCSDIFSISDGYPFLFLVTRDD